MNGHSISCHIGKAKSLRLVHYAGQCTIDNVHYISRWLIRLIGDRIDSMHCQKTLFFRLHSSWQSNLKTSNRSMSIQLLLLQLVITRIYVRLKCKHCYASPTSQLCDTLAKGADEVIQLKIIYSKLPYINLQRSYSAHSAIVHVLKCTLSRYSFS